jgi:hypothetical protein
VAAVSGGWGWGGLSLSARTRSRDPRNGGRPTEGSIVIFRRGRFVARADAARLDVDMATSREAGTQMEPTRCDAGAGREYDCVKIWLRRAVARRERAEILCPYPHGGVAGVAQLRLYLASARVLGLWRHSPMAWVPATGCAPVAAFSYAGDTNSGSGDVLRN